MIAIIRMNMFRNYTGTSSALGYEFLCWDNDKNAKELVKRTQDEGNDVMSVDIPLNDIKEMIFVIAALTPKNAEGEKTLKIWRDKYWPDLKLKSEL